MEDGRVIRVPEHEGEVYAADPVLRWFPILKSLF